jgi:hypothetical protein
MWRMEEIMEVNDEHSKIERGVYLAGLGIRLAILVSYCLHTFNIVFAVL